MTISGGRTGIVAGALPMGGCVLSTAALLGTAPGVRPGSLRTGAGVLLGDFRSEAAKLLPGWFFPPDPTEETASMGGMAATDASGSDSFLYGSTRKWVLALEAVLSGGRIIHLERGQCVFGPDGRCSHPETGVLSMSPAGRSLPKNAAGYMLEKGMDLMDLLLGSEGTMCLITALEVALCRNPGEMITVVAFPDSEEAAWGLVAGLRSSGARVRALEAMDSDCLRFLAGHPTEGVPTPPAGAGSAVICRLEARAGSLEDSMGAVWDLLERFGVEEDRVWGGTEEAEQKRIRAFRHALPEAVNSEIASRRAFVPGIHKLGSDAAVPPEALPSFYDDISGLLRGAGLEHLVFGHAGQGHLHANILPSSPGDLHAGEELMDEIARTAVRAGGTVSAEHGLGRLKAHQLAMMYSDKEIEGMRRLRLALDPDRAFAPAIPWP